MSHPPPAGFYVPPAVPVFNAPGIVGPNPSSVTCPSCRNVITTTVRHTSTTKTHLIALVLCLIGCWPCVCVPYCMDSCRNANHFCSNCSAYIGTYKS